MPWARIDDSLYDHPKLDALGPSRLPCVGLYVLALSWSNRYLTDGFIPADRVRRLGGTVHLAAKLAEAGLWERAGDDYRIHDFMDFNESAADVQHRRDQARISGRLGGLRSGEVRRASSGTEAESKQNGSSGTEAERTNSRPVPSRPIHTRTPPTPPTGLKTKEGPLSLGAILDRAAKEGRPK